MAKKDKEEVATAEESPVKRMTKSACLELIDDELTNIRGMYKSRQLSENLMNQIEHMYKQLRQRVEDEYR